MQRGLGWGAVVVLTVVVVVLRACISAARLMRFAGLASNVKQASVFTRGNRLRVATRNCIFNCNQV